MFADPDDGAAAPVFKRLKSQCSQCHVAEAKYTCPKCGTHTCSVACVKSHKTTTSCDGKRDPSVYVSLAEFTDRVLASDYTFLEEVNRAKEAAGRENDSEKRTDSQRKVSRRGRGRDRKQASSPSEVFPVPTSDQPKSRQDLLREVIARGAKLKLLPVGMSRQQSNTSKIYRRKGTVECLWRVEWHFHSCVPAVHLVSEALSDADPILTVVSKFLSPDPLNASLRHKLRTYTDVAVTDLVFIYHHPYSVGGKPVFIKLNVDDKSTMRDVLIDKDVLEFPTISVLTPGYDKDMYPMLDDAIAAQATVACSDTSDPSSGSGSSSDASTSEEESSSDDDSSDAE